MCMCSYVPSSSLPAGHKWWMVQTVRSIERKLPEGGAEGQLVHDDELYEPEQIIEQKHDAKGHPIFLVRYHGHHQKQSTWQPC
jgi:hypothetical protein